MSHTFANTQQCWQNCVSLPSCHSININFAFLFKCKKYLWNIETVKFHSVTRRFAVLLLLAVLFILPVIFAILIRFIF